MEYLASGSGLLIRHFDELEKGMNPRMNSVSTEH